MTTSPDSLTCEIQLQPGEKLRLPSALTECVGPGHWLITISQLDAMQGRTRVRDHSAFLNGYVAGDEGLYDDYPTR
jgi:hypothetical protein